MFRLEVAARYVQGLAVPKQFKALLLGVKNIFSFSKERTNRIARCVVVTREYASGASVADIMDKHGCSRGTVLRYARAAGLPKRPKHFPPDILAAVLREYKAGVPVATIAKIHSVSPAYVSKEAVKAGLQRKSSKNDKTRAKTKTSS